MKTKGLYFFVGIILVRTHDFKLLMVIRAKQIQSALVFYSCRVSTVKF